jgi:hypothetical protein
MLHLYMNNSVSGLFDVLSLSEVFPAVLYCDCGVMPYIFCIPYHNVIMLLIY